MTAQGRELGDFIEERPIYSSEDLRGIDLDRLPKHIAIIPDGNRRWAKLNAANPKIGHREGADILMDIVKAALELGIPTITFFLFSTENWSRPKEEIDALMWLLESYLIDQRETMLRHGIKLHTIGHLASFPPHIQQVVRDTKEATKNCNKIDLLFALNYGSRDEIRRAVQNIVNDVQAKELEPGQITEELISGYLDTACWKDPDLLIRSSGELRVSNFLLWQISYAEIYVTETLWPDFRPCHLLDAIISFQKRERRLGGA